MKVSVPLFILWLVLGLFACGSSGPRNLNEKPLVIKDRIALDPATMKPYSGPVFETHKDSQVMKKETTLLNGKHHGLLKAWHKNGRKHEETEYANGVLVKGKSWWDNGQLSSETVNINGKKKTTHWNRDGSRNLLLNGINY